MNAKPAALLLLVLLTALLSLVACGEDDADAFDNAAACEAWNTKMAAMTCGNRTLGDTVGTFNCTQYAPYPCDISAFWKCLEDNYQCVSGSVIDVSKWPSCSSKTRCD